MEMILRKSPLVVRQLVAVQLGKPSTWGSLIRTWLVPAQRIIIRGLGLYATDGMLRTCHSSARAGRLLRVRLSYLLCPAFHVLTLPSHQGAHGNNTGSARFCAPEDG